MDNIRLDIIGLQSSHSQTGSCVLMLAEVGGTRKLPVIIGIPEAQAIALELEKILPSRPMTHDLFKSFADNFAITIERIIISDLKEGIFFAKIFCNDGVNSVEIDARPSDAVAIGLRFGVPIYTNENVMSEAGIISTEETVEPALKESVRSTEVSSTSKSNMASYTDEQLKKMLEDALKNEDYEKAARIRDELNKRN